MFGKVFLIIYLLVVANIWYFQAAFFFIANGGKLSGKFVKKLMRCPLMGKYFKPQGKDNVEKPYEV